MSNLDAFQCGEELLCDNEYNTRTFKCNRESVNTDTTSDLADKSDLIVPDTNGELFEWLLLRIHHLEQENRRLQGENIVLKASVYYKEISKCKILAD